MNTKTLTSLFAGALMFALAGAAQADPVYMDLGAGGGVDGHTNRDGAIDPDQQTGTFNEIGVSAQTTTTQFDTDGSGDLSDGDRFSDSGHLDVGSLIPGVIDNEALNQLNGYQITAAWTGLTGTADALSDNGNGTSTGVIRYDTTNNAVFNFFLDDSNNGFTAANYGATVGEHDDVDGTFTDGAPILSILIVGGIGENLFSNATGAFLTGSSVLRGIVVSALDDFLFFEDGDLDFAELVGSMVEIKVSIDQNTNNVITHFCPGDPLCSEDALFVIDSDHNGSISFVVVPEPASVLLFSLGFLALGSITLVTRRQQA